MIRGSECNDKRGVEKLIEKVFCCFGSLKGPTITKFADPNFNFLRPAVRDTGSERGNPKLNVEAVN